MLRNRIAGTEPTALRMSNKKLHPIYVALDAHQYNRAIKLGAALPDDNVLGKALLAHAYSKSGQRYSALLTLHNILGGFCELKHEVECSLQTLKERQQSSSKTISQPEPQAHSSSKKGKKGKKKPAPVTKQQQAACPESDCSGWDLIDQLNTQPALPEKWEDPPADKQAITDEVSKGKKTSVSFRVFTTSKAHSFPPFPDADDTRHFVCDL